MIDPRRQMNLTTDQMGMVRDAQQSAGLLRGSAGGASSGDLTGLLQADGLARAYRSGDAKRVKKILGGMEWLAQQSAANMPYNANGSYAHRNVDYSNMAGGEFMQNLATARVTNGTEAAAAMGGMPNAFDPARSPVGVAVPGSGASGSQTGQLSASSAGNPLSEIRGPRSYMGTETRASSGAQSAAQLQAGASNPLRGGASNPLRGGASNPLRGGASNPLRGGASNPLRGGASNPYRKGANHDSRWRKQSSSRTGSEKADRRKAATM